MELKSRTYFGLYYATMDDLKTVCHKCKQSYFGDHNYLDCEYCVLPTVVKLTEEYANRLDSLYD